MEKKSKSEIQKLTANFLINKYIVKQQKHVSKLPKFSPKIR